MKRLSIFCGVGPLGCSEFCPLSLPTGGEDARPDRRGGRPGGGASRSSDPSCPLPCVDRSRELGRPRSVPEHGARRATLSPADSRAATLWHGRFRGRLRGRAGRGRGRGAASPGRPAPGSPGTPGRRAAPRAPGGPSSRRRGSPRRPCRSRSPSGSRARPARRPGSAGSPSLVLGVVARRSSSSSRPRAARR